MLKFLVPTIVEMEIKEEKTFAEKVFIVNLKIIINNKRVIFLHTNDYVVIFLSYNKLFLII